MTDPKRDWRAEFSLLREADNGKVWYCTNCGGFLIREVQPSSDQSGHSATGICFGCDPQASNENPLGPNKSPRWRRVTCVDDKARLTLDKTPSKRRRESRPEPMFTEGWVKDGSGHERYVERPVSDDLDEYL